MILCDFCAISATVISVQERPTQLNYFIIHMNGLPLDAATLPSVKKGFCENAMYELVYLGRPADCHKLTLVDSKINMAILRKSFHSIVR